MEELTLTGKWSKVRISEGEIDEAAQTLSVPMRESEHGFEVIHVNHNQLAKLLSDEDIERIQEIQGRMSQSESLDEVFDNYHHPSQYNDLTGDWYRGEVQFITPTPGPGHLESEHHHYGFISQEEYSDDVYFELDERKDDIPHEGQKVKFKIANERHPEASEVEIC